MTEGLQTRIARIALGVALVAAPYCALAQRVEDSCHAFFDNPHQALDCVEAVFTQTDIPYHLPHLTMSSIPPANGFPIGIVWEKRTHDISSPFFEASEESGGNQANAPIAYKSLRDFKAAFVISTNTSWYATGAFSWLPPLHYRDDTKTAHGTRKSCHRLGPMCTEQVFGINLSATHRTLQTLYFYGLGPSSPNTQYAYRQTETYGGVDARMPITDWLTIEGQLGNTQPSVQFNTASLASNAITEGTAPGFLSQPDFMHYVVGVDTHTQAISEPVTNDPAVTPPGVPPPPLMKHKLVFVFENGVLQHWYGDQSTGHYSFRRFEFDGNETIRLHSVIRRFVAPDQMTKPLSILKHFCNSRKTGLKVDDECDFGELSIRPRLVSSISTEASGAVPFYFQPTLGGSDIESRLTLRGFNDYRFRAPDAAMIGVEYGVPIFNPIGALVFYDAGTVGNSVSDLSFAHARQDGGYGISLRLLRTVVAEAYLGYGAGHGSRFGYNFTKLF
jgi:hypothetical protein